MAEKKLNDPLRRLLCTKAIKLFTTFILFIAIFHPAVSQEGSPGEIPTDEESIAAGKATFQELCTVCHAVDRKVVGPALMNVYDRRELPWIIAFVKNSQRLIASGDPIAVALYNEYNKTQMNSFDYLSDDEIIDILAYIKYTTDNPATPAAAAAEGAGAAGAGNNCQSGRNSVAIPDSHISRVVSGTGDYPWRFGADYLSFNKISAGKKGAGRGRPGSDWAKSRVRQVFYKLRVFRNADIYICRCCI